LCTASNLAVAVGVDPNTVVKDQSRYSTPCIIPMQVTWNSVLRNICIIDDQWFYLRDPALSGVLFLSKWKQWNIGMRGFKSSVCNAV
jgi:hypothetical protein